MKFAELENIKKLYFCYEDIARTLGISPASARVTASRYVKQGLLLRVKKNMYVLKEKWKALGKEDKFVLANMGQVPSYISLMTALDYYQVTTQIQQDFFESVAIKRSKEISLEGSIFRYVKIASGLYHGFKKEKNFFIASPEKALVDAFYLISHGRYSIDLASLDAAKLDRKQIQRLSKTFPRKTRNILKKHGYI